MVFLIDLKICIKSGGDWQVCRLPPLLPFPLVEMPLAVPAFSPGGGDDLDPADGLGVVVRSFFFLKGLRKEGQPE